MKKICLVSLLTALMALGLAVGACAETGEEPAEWTVLFYFCGSDLESRYGYASDNLEKISELYCPLSLTPILMEDAQEKLDAEFLKTPGKVNVLIETGGSQEWHISNQTMDIDPSALQRWKFSMYGMDEHIETAIDNGYELLETLPLQSMADPGTLADFIRWGRENFPAKKFALVLWDHGDGARSGLFVDELFDKDVMYLYELKQAMADGGTHFEAVIIDACLMANIETAWNLKDSAHWMVASEEIVPGEGTAIGTWLQQLLCYPECDGEWLGRCVCDTTSVKYANEAQAEAKAILTWSVIDLSKVDALAENVGRFYREMGVVLRDYPNIAFSFIRPCFMVTPYGDGQQNMFDFGSMVYNENLVMIMRRSVRNEVIQALSDAVDYCVRGSGRSEARGLTLCYPVDFTDEEMSVYMQNFPIPDYLAYIDAISDWTAPEEVYEAAEYIPEIDEIEGLGILFQRKICSDGMPALLIQTELMPNIDKAYYTLYRLNEETGEVVRLGRTDCICGFANEESPELDLVWRASDPMHWPAVDGELICMDLIQTQYDTKLYNVPAMIDSQPCVLRCGRQVEYNSIDGEERINDYEVYGVWVGYEESSTLLNRSVQPLSTLAGQDYQLLYPIDGSDADGEMDYEFSAPLTMYRALDVEEIPLPPGTYYLEYEIEDIFMRDTVLDRIEIHWDGENMTFPEDFAWDDDAWINLADLRKKQIQ